jgi:hypothetical protein
MTLRAQLRLSLTLLLAVSASCVTEVGDEIGEQSAALSPVTWTNVMNVVATGNDLEKNTIAGWNSGAVSVETITSSGYVEFTTDDNTSYKAAGLSNGDTSQHYNDIDFAVYLMSNGNVRVYESGALRGTFGAYAMGDIFRVEVTGGTVRYSRNGTVFYTSLVAPTFPLLVDTSLYNNGSSILDVNIESATFQNVVNVTVTGDDLEKTAGGTAWNAGASTIDALTGSGSMEFTANGTNTYRMAGLSNGDSSQHYNDIDFAIYVMTLGRLRVYEGGVSRGSFGTYATGDVMRVEASGGTIRYYRNGTLFYTSLVTPTFPLRGDTAFYNVGARIDDIHIIPASFWQNAVGVSATGNDLIKTGTTTGWNAGASSVTSLAGDGYVEFTTDETNRFKAAGLSNGDTDQNYTDIDFAFYLMTLGRVRIYEGGVNRGDFGTYAAGDVFRVQNTGGVVTYSRNGTLLYTSTVAATSPLVADTALHSTGATIRDVVVSP